MAIAVLATCTFVAGHAAAENIKIGCTKVLASCAAVFVAQEWGYFKAEGFDAELVFFDSGQPVAVATAAGEIDFASAGVSGGLYALAGQGALRIIAGGSHEQPGYHLQAFLISNHAWDEGLRTFKDFPGHSVALSQIGSPTQYGLSLLADKYGFDAKTLRLLPLQSIPNMVSAIVGGQADITAMPGTSATAIVEHNQVKLLGWTGDETPWQIGAVWTSTKTANDRRDTVERFLRAYKRGARDYHDAVAGPDERPVEAPTLPAVLAMATNYTGLSVDELKLGIVYLDSEARLDAKDVLTQIAWFRSQGMVKGDFDPNSVIDMRYVVPLPER